MIPGDSLGKATACRLPLFLRFFWTAALIRVSDLLRKIP